MRAFVLRRSAKCQCSCVCVCCVCPMSRATPPHQGTPLSRHRSTGVLKAVTECAAPRAAQPWWREIVGLVESPAQCQRLSPCVSGCARCGFCMAAVASPVSMLGAFACACKVAVGRCGHLLTVGPAGTGLCGQNSLIAFDQRCSKFLVRGPDYLKNSLQFF